MSKKHRKISKHNKKHHNKKHFYKNFNRYYFGMTRSIQLITLSICLISFVILAIYIAVTK